jgi:hypothetical protein
MITIALLLGCSRHYSSRDLVGKYELPVDGGVDSIELQADGTYLHGYKSKSGQTDQQEGTWTLEELQAGSTVVLNDFHPLLAEHVRGQGTYLLLVKSFFGNPYLITNIDLNEGYKKSS